VKTYLDIDGVLADFMRAAMLANKCNPDVALSTWPKGEWEAHKVLGISEDSFWQHISANDYFWDDLQMLPWCRDLIRLVTRHDPEFRFATKPSRCESCYAGKRRWVARLGYDPSERLIVIPDKVELAGPGRLLIDDNDDNCTRWKEAGGTSILFPQVWNSNWKIHDRLRFVRKELGNL
jgi:5'(3')-deoxyribonucleotidase